MDSSLYLGVEDLPTGGLDLLVRDVADVYGCGGIAVAAAYHEARDVTPHGPQRLTLRRDGVHFTPPADLFDGLPLQPTVLVSPGAEPLAELRRSTRSRGLALHGWTVFCHQGTLGLAHPEVTQESCFGDRAAPADLCPANPHVRAYAVALGRAVARLGVESVVAESLHYGQFGHGYHHERSFVRLGEVEEFCFGLCFCPHCLRAAGSAGVDAAAARRSAIWLLERVLTGERPLDLGVTPESLAEVGGEALAGYAVARSGTVTSLAAAVATGVRDEGSTLVFIDLTGAVKGYADGLPAGAPAVEDAWRAGIDPAAVAAVVDGYAVLGYARDVTRLSQDVAAYRAVVGATRLRVVLRPWTPDTHSADHLAAKVAAARDAGADAVDFYHYGLVPRAALGRVPVALNRASRNDG